MADLVFPKFARILPQRLVSDQAKVFYQRRWRRYDRRAERVAR
jgi:hypothetical protein